MPHLLNAGCGQSSIFRYAPPKRLHALDCLRGLAALIVMFQHCLLAFPAGSETSEPWSIRSGWFNYPPFSLLIGGRAAVILFFVLSGFVLSMSLMEKPRYNYLAYLGRRMVRLYAPLTVVILLAALVYGCSPGPTSPTISNWLAEIAGDQHISLVGVIRHFSMSGLTEDMRLDVVLWSLVHEIRVSIILPILVLAVKRHTAVAMLVVLSIYMGSTFLLRGAAWEGTLSNSLLGTAHYLLFSCLVLL